MGRFERGIHKGQPMRSRKFLTAAAPRDQLKNLKPPNAFGRVEYVGENGAVSAAGVSNGIRIGIIGEMIT
jgi:hypothetical protein